MNRRSAARAKCSSSATVTKYLRCRSSTSVGYAASQATDGKPSAGSLRPRVLRVTAGSVPHRAETAPEVSKRDVKGARRFPNAAPDKLAAAVWRAGQPIGG